MEFGVLALISVLGSPGLLHNLLHRSGIPPTRESRNQAVLTTSAAEALAEMPRLRRETVWICLQTDAETIARRKVDRAWSQMIEPSEARLAEAVRTGVSWTDEPTFRGHSREEQR